MRIIIAPPGTGGSTATQVTANLLDAEKLLPVQTVYTTLTEQFGPGWYFNECATHLKDLRMREIRIAIEPFVSTHTALVTRETGLACRGDTIYVVIQEPAHLYATTLQRKEGFRYPSIVVAEQITTYYKQWAQRNHARIYPTVEAAVVDLM